MPDQLIVNETPFAAQEVYLADEEGRDLLVLVVKGTYLLGPGGEPVLAEEQVPVDLTGTYTGEPAISSARFEPEIAPYKPATDVVLVGHAYPDRSGATWVDVGLQVGPVQKIVRVFGDRWWYGGMGAVGISDPQPLEKIPLVYERAFGGWDRTSTDPAEHTFDRRNPVGVGFHDPKHGRFVEGLPLPNLESPYRPITAFSDAPPPAGFGFVGPAWAPRVGLAGTYDQAWLDGRMPLLPTDFDRRFYNAAPADQVAPGYLRGDEPVRVANASPRGSLSFRLPGMPPPQCGVVLRDGKVQAQHAQLDTVIVDTDEDRVLLLWRAAFLLPRRIHEVRSVRVRPQPGARVAAAGAHSY